MYQGIGQPTFTLSNCCYETPPSGRRTGIEKGKAFNRIATVWEKKNGWRMEKKELSFKHAEHMTSRGGRMESQFCTLWRDEPSGTSSH
ncbi:hypothetical protein JZ751_029425 [Albula glossodonta]|uniref:Uncharacterized protein n=1 Tax=Albula glossodonta TaxID=121402 RepID=A0A8T2P988_9TELE|nr:hypothetical protein JZ751_010645 [Albula glossodonta]KAG9349105.1 hypothetical protein JZ751_029425 [Albula glossodonta]